MKKKLFFTIAVFITVSLQAKITMPSVFSNNMVIQQQTNASIWGWGVPLQIVKITANWAPSDTVNVVVSGEGYWKTNIRTIGAGGPYTLKIFTSSDDEIVLQNVMLGEVWLCSGQSNMEWKPSYNILNKNEEIAQANHPEIRIFQIPNMTATTPQNNCVASWELCTSETMKNTSAVGYFFARQLSEKLNVPVGIIVSAWGGTPYETWTKEELIVNNPVLKSVTQFTENKYRPNLPGTCYNAMINPVIPFSVSGVIWYQGESNLGNNYYGLGLQTMINGWRSDFGKNFPFYLVQIAPFDCQSKNNEEALLREQQELVTKLTPNSGIVIISDLVDDISNIHPLDKKNVGIRLANLALGETYKILPEGYKSPSFESMSIEKGALVVTLKDAQTGIVCKGDKIIGLKIAGEDGKFVDADGKMKGNKIIVSSAKIAHPKYMSYCFDDATIGNLFSISGLPVAPFRSNPIESFYKK